MKAATAIVDYGCGNIRSLLNAFRVNDGEAALVTDPEHLMQYQKIVLPGVGAFGAAMEMLLKTGFMESLNDFKKTGKPVLGICLGMQLMCTRSDEVPSDSRVDSLDGLNWIEAEVRHIGKNLSTPVKVPHMGWNELRFKKNSALFEGVENAADVYFVHSHAVHCAHEEDILTSSVYGAEFVSSFARDNIFGMQFHPEKSHKVGLRIIDNFLRMAT
ncbi:MAG: imidazole glycerol phosphate synthase subunit HisH [Oleiphilus sp.]|nr:MAG: imidazole glycerol phosphate synthase subunit HisH [Oleiphilus sp.]